MSRKTTLKQQIAALEKERKVCYKAVEKVNLRIKRLRQKCSHEDCEVSYHEKATAASMYDGSRTVFYMKCNTCGYTDFISAGSPLFQMCWSKAHNTTL